MVSFPQVSPPKTLMHLPSPSYMLHALRSHSYKRFIIISVALFLKVFFYALSNSEFVVLAHNIPGIFIFEKASKKHNVMFF